MDTPPDVIGSAEVCRMLDINAATLSRWVRSGQVGAVAQLPGKNGARLFDRAEVERVKFERGAA